MRKVVLFQNLQEFFQADDAVYKILFPAVLGVFVKPAKASPVINHPVFYRL